MARRRPEGVNRTCTKIITPNRIAPNYDQGRGVAVGDVPKGLFLTGTVFESGIEEKDVITPAKER